MDTMPTEDLNIVSYSKIIATNLGLDKLKTTNGKEIAVVRNERGDFIIQFASGGEKPSEFDGKFTTTRAVTEAISQYLSRKTDVQTTSRKATN